VLVFVPPASTVTEVPVVGAVSTVIVGVNVPLKSPEFAHVTTTDISEGHPVGHVTLHEPQGAPFTVILCIVIVAGCCIFTVIHWFTILFFPPIVVCK